jgi:hypothetical protein
VSAFKAGTLDVDGQEASLPLLLERFDAAPHGLRQLTQG